MKVNITKFPNNSRSSLCISNAMVDLETPFDKIHWTVFLSTISVCCPDKNTILTKVCANNVGADHKNDNQCRRMKSTTELKYPKKWKVKLIVNAKRLSGKKAIWNHCRGKLHYHIRFFFFAFFSVLVHGALKEWLFAHDLQWKPTKKHTDPISLYYYSSLLPLEYFINKLRDALLDAHSLMLVCISFCFISVEHQFACQKSEIAF